MTNPHSVLKNAQVYSICPRAKDYESSNRRENRSERDSRPMRKALVVRCATRNPKVRASSKKRYLTNKTDQYMQKNVESAILIVHSFLIHMKFTLTYSSNVG
jgi:hypothetical protein